MDEAAFNARMTHHYDQLETQLTEYAEHEPEDKLYKLAMKLVDRAAAAGPQEPQDRKGEVTIDALRAAYDSPPA